MTNYRERIANGECVSPYTTDYCPVCVDRCEAFFHKNQINELVKEIDDRNDNKKEAKE